MIIWFNHQPTLSYHVPQCHIYPFLEHPEMVTSALPWVTLSEKKFFLISNNLHWHNLKPLPLSPMMYFIKFVMYVRRYGCCSHQAMQRKQAVQQNSEQTEK